MEHVVQEKRVNLSPAIILRLAVGISAILVLGAMLFVPSFAPYLLRAEHWTADWRTAVLATRPQGQDTRIAIVTIDDDTLRDYVSSPIDRGLLARIITAIDQASAKAIGLDLLLLKQTEAEKDEAFLNAIAAAKNPIVLGALDERGELHPFQRDFQQAYLGKAGRPVGYLNVHHDGDDVVRFMSPPANETRYPKSFAHVLAEAGGASGIDDASRPIPWLGKPANGDETFLTLRAQDILADPAIAAKLKGRFVLVGGDFPFRDRHRVPLTVLDDNELSGVFIHAQILAAILDPGRAISELNPLQARGVLVAVALFGFAIGWQLWRSNIVKYLGAGFATFLLVGLDAICFKELHILLPFTLALVSWVAGLTAGRTLHSVFSVLARRTRL